MPIYRVALFLGQATMNVEEALREFDIRIERLPEYFKIRCPFHGDTNPSGNMHQKTGMFNCFVCQKRTTLVNYLMRYSSLPIWQVKAKIGYKTDCRNPISPTDIEQEHIVIWQYPTFLNALYHRMITDELIRQYRLGIIDRGMEKRISIPIQNDVGEYVNQRMYLPGAADRKFLNAMGKDRSRVRLYPIEQLEYDTILICPGELKALAAIPFLNKYDIGAISTTSSESIDWPSELSERFYGKLLYINGDVDNTGTRCAELRCRSLKSFAREVHKLEFSTEDVGYDPKGDINDFLRIHPAEDSLYQRILEAREWVYIPGGEVLEEQAANISFRDAYSHVNVNKRTKFTGVISGVNNSPYFPASVVEVRCKKNEEFCSLCDVNSQAQTDTDATTIGTEMKIGKEHPLLLALIGEDSDKHSFIYKQCFKIPTKCRQCTFIPKEHYSVTEVMLDEQVDPTSREEPITSRVAFVVNTDMTADQQTYSITGRLYPSPKNQQATFIASSLEPTEDALESYIPSDLHCLEVFQPTEWTIEALESKLTEIYSDLEANVTKIYQRKDYHLAMDLWMHSILHFDFGDIKNINGWTEVLAIGDTGQGKSKVGEMIMKHYGLGKKIDCGNITLAGLTIGLEPGKQKRFAIYGALPRNDKKAILFEELIKMNPKVYQALTECRSSGQVQITKIDHKIRRARVRTFSVSNPPYQREIASYTYGIEVAISVIGTNQDLRRFDLVMIIAKADMDQELLSKQLENPPQYPHVFRDDLCQKLVLRAWKCEEVEFEDTSHLLQLTKQLVDTFGDGPPILDPNTSHLKVAKLSAALAARTNSYSGDKLVVRKCHVEVIAKFLRRNYSSPSCRLDDKSKSNRESGYLRGRDDLLRHLKSIPNAADIVLKLSEIDEITSNYVKELCGDPYIGIQLFARLIQSNAIQKVRSDKYVKTPQFTALLTENKFEIPIPEYVKREKF